MKQTIANRSYIQVRTAHESVAEQVRIAHGRIARPEEVKRILNQQKLSEFYNLLQARRLHKLAASEAVVGQAPTT